MTRINRRDFLGGVLATGTALATSPVPALEAQQPPVTPPPTHPKAEPHAASAIDFRYAPAQRQTAFCFPDDPYKSLVNQAGELLYGYSTAASINYFPLKIGFALNGMQAPEVSGQQLESPTMPIVRTALEYPDISVLLTTFATNLTGEGRVDNVIVEVTSRSSESVSIEPMITIDSLEKFDFESKSGYFTVLHRKSREVLLVGKVNGDGSQEPGTSNMLDGETDCSQKLALHRGQTSKASPYRAFFRLPLANQDTAQIIVGLSDPDDRYEGCCAFWNSWSATHSPVAITVPGRQGEFVQACARNILQAREVHDGKITFQVGPTCYRGLWMADGNFILEAARYLGYDKDAEEGLRTMWTRQQSTGQLIGAAGLGHWKDTGIPLYALVRQCELGQDWSLLHELEPQVVHAIAFLRSLQVRAKQEDSALGRYGLLPKGNSDGGIGGDRDEFANTLLVMFGLKAIARAGEQQKMGSLKDARALFSELEAAFFKAAPQEMRRHESGFEFLPTLLKNDPLWELPDPWDRPRPQSAQWAFSHATFPGLIFPPQHPIVQGHVKLMQAVTKEDIPAETGWAQHEAVWAYNSAFVAEVYLWLGIKQAAHDTFIGFLNHASPQYCWREEQPLQNALVGSYVGDMPHNWASAECIRYTRHMLALEDASHLRLLAGITNGELAPRKEYILTATPTRFGRLNLRLEPLDHGQGWRLKFERESGPMPEQISLPTSLASHFHFTHIEGAHSHSENDLVLVDNSATHWTAFWKA